MNYRLRVASVYLLGFFIDLVNMFIANVAYPEIGRQFDASIGQLAWVSNSYILGLTLVIPLSGGLMGRFGAKRLFMASLLMFIVGTCGVGTSSSVAQLILWRLVQGIGGGLLIPVGQTMTYALFQRHERASLSSVVMLVALLAPALSPAIGGILVDTIGWRWVFMASIPLAALAFALAGFWLKTEARTDPKHPLDLTGLLLGGTAITLILLGLTWLGEPHHFNQGAVILFTGLLALTVYGKHSQNKHQPLINLRLVKDPLLQTAMLIYQFIPGVFTGVSMLTMLYLQNQLDMPAGFVGALMLPWSLAAFAAISLVGKRFNLWGPRPLFITGSVVQAAGILLLMFTAYPADKIVCVLAYALMGFGGSLCSSTAQSTAFILIPDRELADASALWNINRQLSFCLGVTGGSLLFSLLASTGIPAVEAYHMSFFIAASSAAIPIFFCLRIANQNVISILNQEQ